MSFSEIRCIYCWYLVIATSHSILNQSFWNFAHVIPGLQKCTGLDMMFKFIFVTFSTLTLSFSYLRFDEKCTDYGYFSSPTSHASSEKMHMLSMRFLYWFLLPEINIFFFYFVYLFIYFFFYFLFYFILFLFFIFFFFFWGGGGWVGGGGGGWGAWGWGRCDINFTEVWSIFIYATWQLSHIEAAPLRYVLLSFIIYLLTHLCLMISSTFSSGRYICNRRCVCIFVIIIIIIII